MNCLYKEYPLAGNGKNANQNIESIKGNPNTFTLKFIYIQTKTTNKWDKMQAILSESLITTIIGFIINE